jgi:hypothetical protein
VGPSIGSTAAPKGQALRAKVVVANFWNYSSSNLRPLTNPQGVSVLRQKGALEDRTSDNEFLNLKKRAFGFTFS